MNEPSDKRAALLRVSRSVGLIGSLALHGLMVALVAWAPPLPDVDFQLELPSEVEFGVPEAAEMIEPPAPTEVAPPPPTPATPAEPATPEEAPKPKPTPKGPDAGRPEPDAGTADAAAEDDKPDAGKPVAQAEPPKPEIEPKPTTPALGAFAPKGSQINIRLDVAQIRSSPLSEDARLLLADSPDFRAVIDGSGIDAVRDLDRLYLASPDLRRANVVIAGQHTAQPELPQRAVASLANIAGKPAPWKVKNGVHTAPWRNRDETERVVALLTREQFVISPAKDLGRVLAIARAFTEKDEAKAKRLDDAGRTALLALPEGVAAVLTVYDARRFARGNLRGVPTHLEVVGKILPDGGVSVAIRGELENEEAADDAVEYWTKLRDRFASHPLVALIGMRTPLIAASIEREGNELRIEGALTQQQARTLLGFARSTLAPPPVPPMPDKPPPAPPLPPLRQKSAPPAKPSPR